MFVQKDLLMVTYDIGPKMTDDYHIVEANQVDVDMLYIIITLKPLKE